MFEKDKLNLLSVLDALNKSLNIVRISKALMNFMRAREISMRR